MRLVQQTGTAPAATSGGRSAPYGRPEWLREWLENLGQFVALECGCKEDLKSKGLLIIGLTFPQSEILCERCNAWTAISKALKFSEYVGLSPAITPNEPLF